MRKLKYQAKNNTFFDTLKEEVFQSLPENYQVKADKVVLLKASVLLLIYCSILLVMYAFPFGPSTYLLCTILLGIICLPMVLNIGHEAVHRNFSTNQVVNEAAKSVFFLLGTSGYFWELRHNLSHHAYANVKDVDLDIEQTNIIRLSEHQKYHKRHRFQHLYMPFAFCFYTLLWFFVRDFKDLGKKQFGAKRIKKHPTREVVKLFAAKVWHFMAFLIIPFAIVQNLNLVICGFFAFHISASIVTTFALISTHVGEVQEIINPNEEGTLPYSWAEHQLITAADFSTNSTVALHFFAGFNHHVAHHLFPHIPHVYYPILTPLIKKHSAIYGLTYNCYPNLLLCAKSHFKRLKYLSTEI